VRAGHTVPIGPSQATIFADFDFETYSEAGYDWNEETGKRRMLEGANKYGLPAVGSAVYTEHPSAEILCLRYDLKDGFGQRHWNPGMPDPVDLFEHIARGEPIEAHNCLFEYRVWHNIAVRRYGWPPILQIDQLRDSMEKCRAFALPGALAKAGEVLQLTTQKDTDGTRLINLLCCPRNPTKARPTRRVTVEDAPEDALKLYSYCGTDIKTESELSSRIPDLQAEELDFAIATRKMNSRGVAVDLPSSSACISILEQAYDKYNSELQTLTGGTVERTSEGAKLMGWLGGQGVHTKSLDADHVAALLARTDLPPQARRALELQQRVNSAGVKKVYTMLRMANRHGRLEDLFIYHGARTGRDAGADAQPQNLVKAGPKLRWCSAPPCQKPCGAHHTACPHCGSPELGKPTGWSGEAVDATLDVIKSGALVVVEHIFGDAQLAISGCIRGLFVAAEGKEFICSDFSSIEAVVTAMVAGEQWRIDLFRTHGKIYEKSASDITGVPFEEMLAHKERTGEHHPDRNKYGKYAELACGFGGWIGAWKAFGADKHLSEEEIRKAILAWRDASPAIVELWGGQVRGKPWAPERKELFGLEGAAISAVQNPGKAYAYRMIAYCVVDDVLYCRLPSGRYLTYHQPRLTQSPRWPDHLSLSFMGYNTNPKMGPMGWGRIETYGGRLTENCIQAIARDVLREAVLNLEKAGYPIVLRVHDELVAEVPAGYGSIEEFERIMATMPAWAADWPIRAAGGWRGLRYRKE